MGQEKSRPCLQEHINPQMVIEQFFPICHWSRVLGYGGGRCRRKVRCEFEGSKDHRVINIRSGFSDR